MTRKLTVAAMTEAYVDEGVMVDSGVFPVLPNESGKEKIAAFAEEKGCGKKAIRYRLRDWGVSRQRYWGTPIPIIYCDRCGMVPVPEDQLPVVLPKDVPFTGKGGSPLSESQSFAQVACPKCTARRGARPIRWTPSSILLGTFCATLRRNLPMRRSTSTKARYWMAVDQYIGGVEHAVLHLALRALFYQGAARSRSGRESTSRSPICSPKAWCPRRPTVAASITGFFQAT